MGNNSTSNNRESATSTGSPNMGISETLTVLDGSNNEFIFIKKSDGSITFEYKPMQPLDSSSGSYSGGTPVFKNLEPGEWAKLMSMFQSGKTNAKPNAGRSMGSLSLQYQSGTTSDSFIISMSSTINQQLSTFFHAYRT
jgi:hypothetical protein